MELLELFIGVSAALYCLGVMLDCCARHQRWRAALGLGYRKILKETARNLQDPLDLACKVRYGRAFSTCDLQVPMASMADCLHHSKETWQELATVAYSLLHSWG